MPDSRIVAREQVRAVGVALRTEAFLFVAALVVFSVVVIAGAVRFANSAQSAGSHISLTYNVQGAIPMLLVGLLVPFGVWRSEDPTRRAYHLSMPVARGPHTIMKLLSGWIWLMIATLLYLACVIGLGYAVSAITGDASSHGTAPLWAWVAAFTAPTLGYLLVSIPVIGSDHPWRWIGGMVIGYTVLLALLKSFGLADMASAINTITDGRYGLNAALFGGTHEGHYGVTIGITREMMASLQMSRWLLAMPLWIVGSAIAATIASFRHHE